MGEGQRVKKMKEEGKKEAGGAKTHLNEIERNKVQPSQPVQDPSNLPRRPPS